MTTDNKTLAVDVLAVMANAIETYTRLNREARSEEDHLLDIEDAQAARAEVAELIEAIEATRATRGGIMALAASDARVTRLWTALARVKGESA